jgi:hypothetical protein
VLQGVADGQQAGGRNFVGRVGQGVPVRIVEVDQVDGRDTALDRKGV